MVKPFQLAKLPMIYFGEGKISLLPRIARSYGSSVLLITGNIPFEGSDSFRVLMDDFRNERMTVSRIEVTGEPSPSLIDRAVIDAAGSMPDAIIAIGGGSAMDTGKAISAMLPVGGRVIEYLEGVGTSEHPGKKIPFIAVPTTAGTGSEATKNAVLSETGKNGFKRSLRHENFVPDAAIVDPVLTVTCPPELTAASGMDCFTQLVEAYLSTKSNTYTDVLAEKGICSLRDNLIRAFENGSDLEARSGMSFAALISGICLANAGLGTIHGFASSVGALFKIPHGVICGTLMAPANEINVRELRKKGVGDVALKKYAALGRLFARVGEAPEDYYSDAFVEELYNLTSKLKLPRLGSYGITRDDVQRVASVTENKNNPVELSRDQLAEIILSRI